MRYAKKMKYWSRITSSARGEVFNPLIWPFLLATFAYGLGFAVVMPLTGVAPDSSLFSAMSEIGTAFPVIWGSIAIATIIGGLTFLMFNIPPFGKVSGLIGFMLWLFAALCYIISGAWLPLLAVAVPNMIFWIWQYLSLTKFRAEDARDKETMKRYNAGGYDDVNPGIDSRQARLNNRGIDEQ